MAAGDIGEALGEAAEFVAHGNKVGFAVGFEDGDVFIVVTGGYDQYAFSGNAARFLVGFGEAGFAHVLNGSFDVALHFDEGFFAFHHACAGAFAQFFDQFGGYF